MIKVYSNGNDFYNENKELLLANEFTEAFFRLDSPLLVNVSKEEYAIKVYNTDKSLMVLKKEPYNILLSGSKEMVPELLDYLIENDYFIGDYLCDQELGEYILEELKSKGYNFAISLAMDFMECRSRYAPSSDMVEYATDDDVEELCQMMLNFYRDCGLKDKLDKDKIAKTIDRFRIIRQDDKIAAMAKIADYTPTHMKISFVYTRDDYRGRGFAKTICNNILNEIMDLGKYAALNVDQHNPISYHVYSSIGFKRVFSQAIFVKQ